MGKYIHKPTEVEAIFYTGESKSYEETINFIKKRKKYYELNNIDVNQENGLIYFYFTIKGQDKQRIHPNTWLIFGIKGEMYPITDENFKALYKEKEERLGLPS